MDYLFCRTDYIPYAALHDGDKYLIESFRIPIKSAIDGNLFEHPEKSDALPRIAAFGVTKSFYNLPALPAVRDEIDSIVLNGSKGVIPGKAILDKDFTEEALLSTDSGKYNMIHVASHFVFSPGTEYNSYLVLGDGYRLSLGDIRAKKFSFKDVNLLTLSACSTAAGGGVDADGREIDGLAAIAQRKGAKSISRSCKTNNPLQINGMGV